MITLLQSHQKAHLNYTALKSHINDINLESRSASLIFILPIWVQTVQHQLAYMTQHTDDVLGIQCLTTILPVTPNIFRSHPEKSKDRVKEIGRVYLAMTNISEFSDLI
ncbi:unnamed protein product [Schistosoma bovis]|nr:unnamed protein product [Schistosoma bovis]